MRNGGLSGRVALVTGASSGIGRAVAAALAGAGAAVALVGRDPVRLARSLEEALAAGAPEGACFTADLRREEEAAALAGAASRRFGRIDILIHSSGIYERGGVAETPVESLDRQYAANLRAPYLLTKLLLPGLAAGGGDIVFMNSTQGLQAGPGLGAYAAMHHAGKALADALRAEVNAAGIRVLSLFLGRTATPRMEAICAAEGRAYQPDSLLQPADVGALVAAALSLPRTAEVTSIAMRPAVKTY